MTAEVPVHLLFPLASSLLYVASALSLKRATSLGAGVWRTTLYLNVMAAVAFAWLPLAPILGPTAAGDRTLWQPLANGSLFFLGQLATTIALQRGDVSVATPIIGTKVVFVATFVTLLMGTTLPWTLWLSAGFSAVGIALLNLRPTKSPRHSLGVTVVASLVAAASYGLFDVLVRKWSPVWGGGRFLATTFAFSTLLSLPLVAWSEGPLFRLPAGATSPLLVGSALLALQALLLVTTLARFDDTTRINIVYNSRGLWSVLIVWLFGHWWDNREMAGGVLVPRLAGAALLLAAIVLAVT